MIVFFLTIGLLSASLPYSNANCDIKNVSTCDFTVHCTKFAGRIAGAPNCGDSKVFLRLSGVTLNSLSLGFFGNTNFDSYVREIIVDPDSHINILTGSCFRYFVNAKKVTLSGIFIYEIKDEAFKDLANVISLDLSHNFISTIVPYSFYLESDQYYSSLEYLDLSHNLINHIPDHAFKYVKKIKTILLNNNRLSTISDQAFQSGQSTPLRINDLFLQNNQLPSINSTLVPLKELHALDLSNNHLILLSASELNRLTNITSLNASYNNIETLETNYFNQAFDIQIIDLQHNEISMRIKNIMFINCNKLKYLDLSYNKIYSIEGASFEQNVLSYFNVSHNNYSGVIQENTFAGLRDIKELDLSGQNVTTLDQKAFSPMINLKKLNLSRNHITNIQNNSFENVDSLNVLDLSQNMISDLVFLKSYLYNLTELYLNDNNLTKIDTGDFENQTSLIRIDLSNNNIIKIETFALPLHNLQYLKLDGNKLEGLIEKNVFSPANYLRYLDLSNFKFLEINEEAFVDMPLLVKLNLSHNAVTKVDNKNFKGLHNMYLIDLSYNNIHEIYFIASPFPSLLSIYLNNNNLKNVADAFKNAQNLTYINLSHNKITNVSSLSNFPNIEHLDLSHNELTSFDSNTTKLKVLDITANKIEVINLSTYEQLQQVSLSNNSISHFNLTQFKGLTQVIYLDLSENLIDGIPIGIFKDLNALKYLNLSYNNISELSYGSLVGLQEIIVLDLSHNEIMNLELDVFHECSKMTKLILDYNHIDSLDVDSLQSNAPSLELVSIGGNHISCKEIVRLKKDSNHKNVNITSIDKVYHEGNVYGIKCGKAIVETSSKKPVIVVVHHTSSTLIIWILVVIVICIVIVYGYKYLKRRNAEFIPNNVITTRNLMELNSEYDGGTI